MTSNSLVTVYGRVLRYAGPLVLAAVLIADPRWTREAPSSRHRRRVCGGCCCAVQLPLSKYAYLTQLGVVALAGSLLVGLPAAALAVAVSTLAGATGCGWHRKAPSAAAVNAGREVVTVVAAYGVYAALVQT